MGMIDDYSGGIRSGVYKCARCGAHHDDLLFRKLSNPVVFGSKGENIAWTHWIPCPTTGEPIMLRVVHLGVAGLENG